jgi:hypothetical protein
MELGLNYTGQETGMVQTIKNLQRQLAEANAIVSKWGLNFEVKVAPNPSGAFDISVNATRGEKASTQVIPMSRVLFYAEDAAGLIAELEESIYDMLLKHLIREELSPLVTRAVTNVTKLSRK